MPTELRRILCVDDEPDVLAVAQMALETVGGFAVDAVHSGVRAVEAAAATKPDAILLDVMMPQMDGPATLKALRDNPNLRDVPIIFMSARVRNSEIEEYLALGANGVVAKPFDPMMLSSQIKEIWEKFHAV